MFLDKPQMRYLFFLSFFRKGVGGGEGRCWEKNNKKSRTFLSHRKLVLLSCSPDCSMMVPASNHSTCSFSWWGGCWYTMEPRVQAVGIVGWGEVGARLRVRVRWSVRPVIRRIPWPRCTEDTVHGAQLKTVCFCNKCFGIYQSRKYTISACLRAWRSSCLNQRPAVVETHHNLLDTDEQMNG